MATDVAVVALTFDGNDIQDLGGIFLDLERGGPGEIAEVRGRDDIVPGLDGRIARNRRLDRRVVELRGFVCGTGADEEAQRADYWANRIQLAEWFDPTHIGILSATIPGGLIYTLSARTLPLILYQQTVPSRADVSIELESIDPDWVLVGS